MRVVVFCHSLASCWNHGNAHFLRSIAFKYVDARGLGTSSSRISSSDASVVTLRSSAVGSR